MDLHRAGKFVLVDIVVMEEEGLYVVMLEVMVDSHVDTEDTMEVESLIELSVMAGDISVVLGQSLMVEAWI